MEDVGWGGERLGVLLLYCNSGQIAAGRRAHDRNLSLAGWRNSRCVARWRRCGRRDTICLGGKSPLVGELV